MLRSAMAWHLLVVLFTMVTIKGALIMASDFHGPSFVSEPSAFVDFSNNTGTSLHCSARGNPVPEVTWTYADGMRVPPVPRLRHILQNGSLVLPPFRAEDYRQDVHATIYTCRASNNIGVIVSRDIRVRAVVMQVYEVQVYDEFVITGNTAVLRCHIPSFVEDYVTVTSWIRNSEEIFPASTNSGKYVVLPTGELHVRDVSKSDGYLTYRCRTTHRLTRETKLSGTAGRLIVTDPHSSIPPRITDSRQSVTAHQGETVLLPCVGQGYPVPTYSWLFRTEDGKYQSLPVMGKFREFSGNLMLENIRPSDSGTYVCVVNNTVGSEKVETVLIVKAPLSAAITPPTQVVDIGKPLTFRCIVSGFPVPALKWVKDGREVERGRVAFLSKEVLRINQANREDRGMYQCILSNNFDSVQASAELRLGDVSPVLHAVFTEKITPPDTFVSLKCVASGSPTPQITWLLDDEAIIPTERVQQGHYVDRDGNVVSQMNITRSRLEDGGEYTCTASNKISKVHHSARLNIYGRPYIRPFRRKSVVAGEDVVIKCPYAGHPIESVQWEKGGRRLPIDHRQVVFLNGTLLVRSIQRDQDAGTYTCTIGSPDGQTATRDLEVMVRVPPNIIPFSFPDEQKHIGMRVRVVCVISQGDLPLSIAWLKDGLPVHSDLGVSVQSLDEYTSSLVISRVTMRHNGNYTCLANNAAAAASYTAQLLANVPPRWVKEPRDTEVLAGGRVVIDCQADGFPGPKVTWMKAVENVPGDYVEIPHANSRIRQLDNGSLLISEARIDDRGRYSCRASNGVGTGLSHVIILDVHVSAQFEIKVQNMTVRHGEEIQLTCEAQGDHPLEISWFKNKEKLITDRQPRMMMKKTKTKHGVVSVLMITESAGEDSGLYRCTAKNIYGSDETHFYLIITEPPGSPRNPTVMESSSRSVTFMWSKPYDGNSPINQYVVQVKPASVTWEERSHNISVAGGELTAILSDLQPATNYHGRIWAVNTAGSGPTSDIINFATAEEAPSGPPRNVKVEILEARVVRVSWKPPKRDTWNGHIRGYYVGYKVHDSSEPYTFRTVETPNIDENLISVEIADLRQFTKYGFIVQAFNQVGTSPRSDEVVLLTSEDTPSQSPDHVQCSAISSTSIHVTWHPVAASAINGVLQGYKVVYKIAEEWYDSDPMETKITSGLSCMLSGLEKFSNYSIQVLAYTRVGDGIKSESIYCNTKEDVPDAPSDIKAVAMTLDSVMVSWKPPLKPNGILKNYNLYMRTLEHSKEEITKQSVPTTTTFYEAINLKKNRRYEFWVTALTSVGEGQSTRVVSQSPSGPIVPAKIVSFGSQLTAPWRDTITLPCRAIGIPLPDKEWRFGTEVLDLSDRVRTQADGSLTIKDVHDIDAGSYTCRASNSYGTDEITYKLLIQVPPEPPAVSVSRINEHSFQVQWKDAVSGGAPIQGYTLYYKREFGEWEEVVLQNDVKTFTLDELECGTKYQVYMEAHNRLGTSRPSDIVSAKTKGEAPTQPTEDQFIRPESSSVALLLESWTSGGCPILYFVVKYRMMSQKSWKLVSNNVLLQQREFIIPDLSAATWYGLQVTAHNNAGSTIAEYRFATRTLTGGTLAPYGIGHDSSRSYFTSNWKIFIAVLASTIFLLFLLGVFCFCYRIRKQDLANNASETQPQQMPDAGTTKLLRHTPEKGSSAGSFTYLLSNNTARLNKNVISGAHQFTKKDNSSDISPYATAQLTQENEMKTFTQRQLPQVYPHLRNEYRDGTFPRTRKESLQQLPRADSLYSTEYASPVTECEEPNIGTTRLMMYGSQPRVIRPSAPMAYETHVPDLLDHGPESSTSDDASPEVYIRSRTGDPDAYDKSRIISGYEMNEARFIFNEGHEPMRSRSNSQEISDTECDRDTFFKRELDNSKYRKSYENDNAEVIHRDMGGYPVQRPFSKDYSDEFTIAV